MSSEYKEYIETSDPSKKIRCDVFYFKERRRYSASLALVEIEDHGNGMRSETFTIYQDNLNHSLLTVDRKSKKATDTAIQMFKEVKNTLIETLLKDKDITLLT